MNDNFSNYDKMKKITSKNFLENDQEKMIEKFRLIHNDEYIYVNIVGRLYRIERATGKTEWSDDDFATINEAGFNEVMTIYDVLCNAKNNCCASNEFVHLNSLSLIKGGALPPKDNFFQKYADFFDVKTNLLKKACEALHGEIFSPGDLAYKLKMFDFLEVSVHFWNSDDEFAPSLQILTDKNILDFMHYETLMFALSHLMERLKEEAIKFE